MKVFCMTNCWTNYDVVASAIVEKWVKKGLATNGINDYEIKSFYRNTPYLGYFAVGSGLAAFSAAFDCFPARKDLDPPISGSGVSQQFAVYIWVISIAAVVLAHCMWADLIFIENDSVVTLPMVAAIEAIAASLGKQIVYWRDDNRMQWGTTNDPVTVGMLPSAYKFMWNASSNQAQNKDFNAQQSNNNPVGVRGIMGSEDNKCVHFLSSGDVFSDKWTTIARAIHSAKVNTPASPYAALGTRMAALAEIGKNIIQFTEVTKPANSYYKKNFGSGWIPSPPPASDPKIGNTTLYVDCLHVILASVAPDLLDPATLGGTGIAKKVTSFPKDEIDFITENFNMSWLGKENKGVPKCPPGYTTSFYPSDPKCPNGWCGCSEMPSSSGPGAEQDMSLSGGASAVRNVHNTGLPFGTRARTSAASTGIPLIMGALGRQLGGGTPVGGVRDARAVPADAPTRFPSYPNVKQ